MKKLTFIALALIGILSACKKDFNQDENKGLDLAAFNTKFSIPTQQFNQVAGTTFTITGTKGVVMDFPSNAFLDVAGNAVTGAIKLSLKEVLTKRDIMLSGKMTTSNGQLLVSGGEFQIIAMQNGNLLKLNPAAAINVKVPTTLSTEPMDLFTFGAATASDSTWVQNQKFRVTTTPAYYQFVLPNFGWVNCDYFYSNPNPKTTLTASPTYAGTIPSIKDQRAYLVFNSINTVVGLPFVVALNKHQSYINSLPVGMTAKLVIISVGTNDKIYFGHADVTIATDLHVNVPLSVGNQATIDAYLNNL